MTTLYTDYIINVMGSINILGGTRESLQPTIKGGVCLHDAIRCYSSSRILTRENVARSALEKRILPQEKGAAESTRSCSRTIPTTDCIPSNDPPPNEQQLTNMQMRLSLSSQRDELINPFFAQEALCDTGSGSWTVNSLFLSSTSLQLSGESSDIVHHPRGKFHVYHQN
ncbi:hypothetical protein HNY73_008853 [Argiope bruennichi]|uniref:Uncharacterized protein n=1 Tax=Argiope bruennichi TaxID=94029 RepID=A0A8T0F8N7_ARGBR|nr:hypothetical protein HNY73_008853 [Argiope bruennichi]